MRDLPPLRLVGAEVLRPDGLARVPVSVAQGRVVLGGGHDVDLTGYRILPGIVDLHGDGFERHLAPRRGALESLAAGLAGLDAELAANGITTAVLAQFVSWEGGMRGADFAEAMVAAVAATPTLIDMRVQLRLETHLTEEFDRVLRLTRRPVVDYVVFNDHLPHAALDAGKRPPRLNGQALKAGRSPEAHLELLRALHDRGPGIPAALATLSRGLRAQGVRIGSHDDRTPEDRARFRAVGADISEFPETVAAAEAARAAGEVVVMGAPNVVRGGSHAGKASARALVEAGLVDALASDYHYPSPARAVSALVAGGMDIAAAWALISSRPAEVMGWTDRGRIEPGARADLVIMEIASGRIEGTLAGGRAAYLAGGLAARLLGAGACD